MRITNCAQQLREIELFIDYTVIENEAHFTDVHAWHTVSSKINGDGFHQEPKGTSS